jgi:hypothetical protein
MATTFLSDIAYHDYVLLVSKMDSEWGRRCKEGSDYPPMDNHRQMRKACLDYGRGINRNYDLWRKGNGDSRPPAYLKPYLYNPMGYFAIGHADDACLVLTDDDPSAHYLTMRVSRKIEDIWLADCPRMAELSSAVGLKEVAGPRLFWEPHELFDAEHGPTLSADQEEGLRVHAVQRQAPFLVFTRCRMDGLMCVRHFLLAQQAIYKAMVGRIRETVQNLRDWCHSDEPPPPAMLRTEDVDSLRCCLLDLRGAEEIGLLAFCTNVSVAASIVVRLRQLQYWHALEEEEELRLLYEQDQCLRLIVQECFNDPALEGPSCVKKIEGNHLFRWTTTSVLVAPPAFLAEDRARCNGLLRLGTRWQAAPGHEGRLKSCIGGATDSGGSVLWQPFPLGKVDLIETVTRNCNADPLGEPGGPDGQRRIDCETPGRPFVRAEAVLQHIRRCALAVTEDAWNAKGTPPSTGRHWIDYDADVEAPVPPPAVLLENDVAPKGLEHCAALGDVLSRVQTRLWPGPPSTRAEGVHSTDDGLPLSMRDLHKYTGRSGLPDKLRQTIEGLYQMFFTVLADPLRFDMVLDLYDAFAALHRILTRVLWKEMEPRPPWETRLRMLDRVRVHQIAEFVEAVEDALRHRIAKLYTSEGPLDMAVDFRGGLNQVLLAASASMLCSLGLYRRCLVEPILKQSAGSEYDPREAHGIIGVVSKVSLLPGLAATPVLLGYEAIGMPQLAFFRADVPHYLHVASHADYLHEAGHLVFRNVFTPDAPPEFQCPHFERLWGLRLSSRLEDQREFRAVSRRLGEVFATFFGHVFLFGSECTTSMLHHMSLFARSLEAVAAPDDTGHVELDATQRFMEMGLRLYLVRLLLPSTNGVPVEVWLNSHMHLVPQEEAETGFLGFLDMVGPCHPDYESLMRPGCPLRGDLQRHARRVFQQGYKALGRYLPWVFRTVATIHANYREIAVLPSADDGQAQTAIAKAATECLLRGRPILRHRLPPGMSAGPKGDASADMPAELRDPYADPLFVITTCLREYIGWTEQGRGKRLVLDRGRDGATIDFPGGDRLWYEFQVDPGTAHMFCPVPEARAVRTRKQIALRKTLRDIASTLHGRRLYRIVHEALRADAHA